MNWTGAPHPGRRLVPALIVTVAIIGVILHAVTRAPAREAENHSNNVGRWSGIAVDPRPFPAGEHAEQGERLYGWNCMPCHGLEGKGDGPQAIRWGLRPCDFTRGRFKLKSSLPEDPPLDEDLFRSIGSGFPDGAMPAFALFTAEEQWALVDHVKSLGRTQFGAGRSRLLAPYRSPEEGDPIRGGRLFRETIGCAQCHGVDGRGNGPVAPTLVDAEDRPASLPDLARGELSFKAGSLRGDVYRVLWTGLAGTAMPSFLSLPERDRWDLACFVTSLYQPAAPGERLYFERGCAQCHSMGNGKRVGPDLAGLSGRRSEAWLRRWLKDPAALLATDEQARALAKAYPVTMPNLNLSDGEVEQLIQYLRGSAGTR